MKVLRPVTLGSIDLAVSRTLSQSGNVGWVSGGEGTTIGSSAGGLAVPSPGSPAITKLDGVELRDDVGDVGVPLAELGVSVGAGSTIAASPPAIAASLSAAGLICGPAASSACWPLAPGKLPRSFRASSTGGSVASAVGGVALRRGDTGTEPASSDMGADATEVLGDNGVGASEASQGFDGSGSSGIP
jgi:hypothetical protein